MIVDLDNTLLAWHDPAPCCRLESWMSDLRSSGLKACIVSNNFPDRVNAIASTFGIPGIAKASKPRSRAFFEAMRLMRTSPGSTAVIGDQVFTDILGGNRLGLYTILVQPTSRREFVGTKIVRAFESLVLWMLRRNGMLGPIATPVHDD